MRRSLGRCVLGVILLLSACGTPTQLDLEDTAATLRTVRVLMSVGSSFLGEREEGRQPEVFLVGELDTARADQGGIEFDMDHVFLGMEGALPVAERWSVTPSVGLGYHGLDVRGPASFQEDRNSIGFEGGVRLSFAPHPRGSLFAEARFLALEVGRETRFDLGGRFELLPHLNVLAGYRRWEFQDDDITVFGGVPDDIEVQAAGLFVGLEGSF